MGLEVSQPHGGPVLVTLKDGTRYQGICGEASFISSEPTHRDVFLERIYTLGEDGPEWQDVGAVSLLIGAGEVRTIEFRHHLQAEADGFADKGVPA